jgi:putative transposase
MARRARIKIAGHPLHITQRGINRAACFFGDGDRALFLSMLEEVGALFPCDIHAYVLMTNHVHLLLTPHAVGSGSLLMKHLGQRYVQAFNRRHARTGTLWEGRFRSFIIDSEAYLLRCQRYIEMNPVRAGMVSRPQDHAWSSHRSNAYGEPSRLLTPHRLYSSLGIGADNRQNRYRELFDDPISDADLARIRHSVNSGLPLGRAAFVADLGRTLNQRVTAGAAGRPRKPGARRSGTDPNFPQSGISGSVPGLVT